MKDKKFTVYFEGKCDWYGTLPEVEIKGYYAESQPHYKWSFTEDINKAKVWKTLNGVNNKIKHAKGCAYRDLTAKIVEIEETLNIKII